MGVSTQTILKVAVVVHLFLLGFFTHWLLTAIPSPLQKPLSQYTLPLGATEKISPSDWISDRDIRMQSDGVFIKVDNPILAGFEDSNSMDPLLDSTANAIEVVPKTPEDIHVGDIASYDTKQGTIIHRVIETGTDEDGWYARFKGDNNPSPDPEKVRFKDIRRVAIAIVY
jgi:hypothetical protein